MSDKKTVLAIDDNLVQLNMFKNILSKNYNIWTVNSASNALNFLNQNTVDLILLDIEMPNISGFDFLFDIRRIPSYMTVPIIIISGKAGEDFLSAAKESSAADVMGKPVEPDVLIKTIEKVLALNSNDVPKT